MQFHRPDFTCREKLVIGVSRYYLFHCSNDTPSIAQIREEVRSYDSEWVLEPLMQVWDVIMACSKDKLVLHQPDSPCRSAHEQAILLALHCLGNGDARMARISLMSILPETAVRVVLPELVRLQQGFAIDALAEEAYRDTREPARQPAEPMLH